MQRLFVTAAILMIMVLSTSALAGDERTGEIHIMQAWARATAGRVPNGVAYMMLKNKGSEPDRLIGASSPVAKRAGLHTSRMEGGMMKMVPVTAIEVGPGGSAMLKPGGLHVMLMGLKAPLKEGETFPLTLTFERSGAVTIDVAVKKPGAMGAGSMKH